jgi:hypothetical protein
MADNKRGFAEGIRNLGSRLNPIPRLRALGSNMAARPGLTAATFIGNALLPGSGTAISRIGNWAYDRQFDNSAQRNNARVQQIGDAAAQEAMNRPLNGALGQFNQGHQNPLVQAMMGPSTYGGQQALNSGGYNVQNQWGQSKPQSILSGMPQGPSMGPDLSGLDAALARANAGGMRVKEFGGKGWGGVARGAAAGEMGVMGPGANGEALIRGLMPMGRAVFNKRDLERG